MPPEIQAAMYAPAQRLGARSFSVPIEPISEEGDAGWLLSFADLVTLLLTVFVLLFAYSRVPAGTAGHPTPEPAHAPTARTAPIPGLSAGAAPDVSSIMRMAPTIQIPYAPRPDTPPGRVAAPASASASASPQPTSSASASDTAARHGTHAPRIRAVSILIPKDLQGKIEVMRSATAVNLIITDDLLYPAGDAQLSTAGRALLDRIAAMLKRSRYAVSVEGYTDDTPIHTARFPSNWELSTARATTVARYLIRRGVAPARLSAIGYGDTRPRADNATAAGRALNRRVTLVLHVKTPRSESGGQST